MCYNLKNVFASEVTSCILKDMNEVKQSMYRLISSAVRPNILHDLNIHINTEDDCSTRTLADQWKCMQELMTEFIVTRWGICIIWLHWPGYWVCCLSFTLHYVFMFLEDPRDWLPTTNKPRTIKINYFCLNVWIFLCEMTD